MAISLINPPPEIVFSKNPVLFTFSTDNRFSAIGRPFIGQLQFSTGHVDGRSFKLAWGGSEYTYIFKNAPDNSGLQLPAYQSGTVSDWLVLVAAALERHYYLFNDFIITKPTADTLRFTSRVSSTSYAITYTNVSLMTATYSVVQTAQDRVLRKNFAIYLELWVENVARTEFVRHSQTVSEVDSEGIANWDVQDYLTAIMLADGPLLPDLDNDVIYVDRMSVRRFYIRYAEMYGEPQNITRFDQTDNFVAILGGSHDMVDALERFVVNGLPRWAHDVRASDFQMHVSQIGHASIINLVDDIAESVHFKMQIFYEDRMQEVVELGSLPEWKLYDKIVVPIGIPQIVHLARDDVEISSIMLWVESGGVPVSDTYSRMIDNRYLRYGLTLCYLDSVGCISTLYTYGRKQRSYEVEKTQDTFAHIDRPTQHKTRELDIDIRDVLKINTGFAPAKMIWVYRDFILSTYKYIIQDEKLVPVVLDSSSIDERDDANNLESLTFGVKYANEQRNF
ncbi:hypothetical protein FAZ19_19640 [Sphingobacterium alkalisoli]|uniref:Uncharacterized protein n=1 Tax=Sphingobacterium alkalisoli TaxID=1874115 RepID=A0A4U0GVS1_9SPHI|nr:hypothetical protein [Sphingobacterium alkalisoli]TJY62684.1 hypothetical protein FAZ19_19640 [Sphingobacterium alkalisoli]GGH28205.1 hypothetical protein GCM10011418_38680 [Sphingobacterium alkalisoli]